MKTKINVYDPRYTPNVFIQLLKDHLDITKDLSLSIAWGIDVSTISKIRHKTLCIGKTALLKAHEATGLSFDVLNDAMYKPVLRICLRPCLRL